MRLFVAFEIPDELRARLAERVERLRPALPPARWVRRDQLHLTLVFLGEVREERLAAIEGGLRPVFAGAGPLRLRLAPPGTFPPGRPARVAWIGIEAGGADLPGLERRAREALAGVLDGALEDRPYHAHVTLARPRRPWNRRAADAFRDGLLGVTGEWRATRAVLYHSQQSTAGSRYQVQQCYPLEGGGSPG